MVRFGLTLLVPSSLTVVGRVAEISYFSGPIVRAICLFSLSLAFVCFMSRYCQIQMLVHHRWQRRRGHRLAVAHS